MPLPRSWSPHRWLAWLPKGQRGEALARVSAGRFHPCRALGDARPTGPRKRGAPTIMWTDGLGPEVLLSFLLLFPTSPLVIPQNVRGIRGKVGFSSGRLVGQGAGGRQQGWGERCGEHTSVYGHGHVHASPDKGGTGLWELLAPASLATAKDLGAWFCLSRSPAPTIDRPP